MSLLHFFIVAIVIVDSVPVRLHPLNERRLLRPHVGGSAAAGERSRHELCEHGEIEYKSSAVKCSGK